VVDSSPVHPNNVNYIASIGTNTSMHSGFGMSWQGTDIGIPYTVISQNQTTVPIDFLYWEESDLNTGGCSTGGANDVGYYLISGNSNIEGGSDKHMLLLQQNTCMLSEISNVQFDGTLWSGRSGAIWDLNQN